MSQIILKHLDAIAASMELLRVQLEAMRHAVSIPAPEIPASRPSDLPPRCAGILGADCALRDGDWNTSRRTFGNRTHVYCEGCGHEGTAATGE